MDGDNLDFKISTFQEALMTLWCPGCFALWAADFENPTCICAPEGNYAETRVFNLADLILLHNYYNRYEFYGASCWLLQPMPLWAFIMETSPDWVDLP